MRTDQPPSSQALSHQVRSNHARLGEFFRTRREQTRPEDVGLPVSSRRRTPGLRREEVAVLANVGVSWYTWLEQGRAIGASEEILDAISNALQLSPEDRTYVGRLASGRRSTKWADSNLAGQPRQEGGWPGAQPGAQRFDVDHGELALLQQLVDAMANPSYIADPLWTVVAMNSAAADTFDTRLGESCLQRFFTDPELARPHVHQEMMARSMVAQFRAQSAKFPDDPRFDIMARSLCEVSDAFRGLWERQVVGDSYHVDVVYDHQSLGRLSFAPMVLGVPRFPALRLFTYLPKGGTGTQAALLGLNRKAVI
ncbi:helix-turn-helix transcriptional regulator [Arthrobacter sp. FW306-2-2C-D06B]|uniref:helix-turn-helix transcriptional regulator n=1 Tax=Arthrobacter sp. FW306-2-2C-D06B TaxID=2879618 RepID=UPI001F38E65C|nr:helix-turn-helix transcriptional regulator [Arthrobacter sp. FW306-2-2C-D06B]UKA58261.1 helix-turn-helix transcriptional regulator [Arthrobacter sp. FW306-2-2C-D06B]